MSWKPRNAGWDRGMKRYQKKGGGYGYYDPNSNGFEYIFLGLILLTVGILIIPLDIMPLPPILIIGGLFYLISELSFELNKPKIKLSKKATLFKKYEKLVDESKSKNKLKKMPKSMVKKKINEWAKTDEIKPYWEDTLSAREYGDPEFIEDDELSLKWNIWKMKQGYKADAEE